MYAISDKSDRSCQRANGYLDDGQGDIDNYADVGYAADILVICGYLFVIHGIYPEKPMFTPY
jgi:hypothetical protein